MRTKRLASLIVAVIMLVVSVVSFTGCSDKELDPYEFVEKLLAPDDDDIVFEAEKGIGLSFNLPENEFFKNYLQLGAVNAEMACGKDGSASLLANVELMQQMLELKGYFNEKFAGLYFTPLGDSVYGTDLTKFKENFASSVFANPESNVYFGDNVLSSLDFGKMPDFSKYDERFETLWKSAVKAEMIKGENKEKTAHFTLDNAGIEAICRGTYQIVKDDAELLDYVKQSVKAANDLVTSFAPTVDAVLNEPTLDFGINGIDDSQGEIQIDLGQNESEKEPVIGEDAGDIAEIISEMIGDIDSFFASEDRLNTLMTKLNERTILITLDMKGDKDVHFLGAAFDAAVTDKDNKKNSLKVNLTKTGLSYDLEIITDAEGKTEELKLSLAVTTVAEGQYDAVLSGTEKSEGKEKTKEVLKFSLDTKAKTFKIVLPNAEEEADSDEADDSASDLDALSKLGEVTLNGSYDITKNQIKVTISELGMIGVKLPLNAVITMIADPKVADAPSDYVEITKLTEDEANELFEKIGELLGDPGNEQENEGYEEEDWDPVQYHYVNPQDEDNIDVILEVNEATSRCAIVTSELRASTADETGGVFRITREYSPYEMNADGSITIAPPEYISREMIVFGDNEDAVRDDYLTKLKDKLMNDEIDADTLETETAMINGRTLYSEAVEGNALNAVLNDDGTFTLAA